MIKLSVSLNSPSTNTINEATERVVSAHDSKELKNKFLRNDNFEKMVMAKFMKDVFIPILKSITTEEKIFEMMKFVKRFGKFFEKGVLIPRKFYDEKHEYLDSPFLYIYNDDVPPKLRRYLRTVRTMRKHLMYYLVFRKFYNEDSKKIFADELTYFFSALYDLDAGELSVPIVKRIGPAGDSQQGVLQKNLRILNDKFPKLTAEHLRDVDLLNKFEIGKELGAGYYGTVYEMKGINRALKVFENSVSLKKDIDRMNTMMEQVFRGDASVEDMHYFDQGKINVGGKYEVYYAVMPLIIPLSSTDEFKKNEISFRALSSVIQGAAGYYPKTISLDEYIRITKEKLDHMYSSDPRYNPLKVISDDMLMKILKAAHRAITQFRGIDLHLWNIGFLKQKPDVYFFYDM